MTINELQEQALTMSAPYMAKLAPIAVANTKKVLAAFKENQLSDYHFNGTSGYGYDDVGRETLDKVYASIFKAEAAIVRPQFVSGTHALATVLMAVVGNGEKGKEILSAVGAPYDTMRTVIGTSGATKDNLIARGFIYKEAPTVDGKYDLEGIGELVTPETAVVLIQRSRGYSTRNPLSIEDIEVIIKTVKAKNPETICFVDNCYGEFTDTREPIEVGADILAGSLIKNLGGGIAPTGAYVAGRADLVEKTADYLTAPGLGSHMGSYAPGYRLFFQGLFLAPHVVVEALKGAIFTAAVMKLMGYQVFPQMEDNRLDLIQSVQLHSAKEMEYFCQGLQAYSPVDAHVKPIPGDLPGYKDKIIMACGAFVQGSSIELSADGPIREPYLIYVQGGLVFEHSMLGILGAAEELLKHR